jgi:hypothetical protein
MKLWLKVLLGLVAIYVLIVSVRWLAFNRVQAHTDQCRSDLNVKKRYEQATDDAQRLALAVEISACAQSRAGWFEQLVFYRQVP